jgi:dUTP pyrophosphatase
MSNVIKFKTHHDSAFIPTRASDDEVGFDLTIHSVSKKIDDYTSLYDTHISVEPPKGYYFEVVPRSSLSKLGYILSNSIGIIDPSYRGSIKIALTKINPEVKNIELPNKRFQLIPRKFISNIFTTSIVDELSETDRGDGGFGSTD